MDLDGGGPRPPEPVPEGTACPIHEDRPALVRCPRCGEPACIVCWHQAIGRCLSCLRRDPTAGAPRVPFEAGDRGFLGRVGATLTSAIHPIRTASEMARPELRPAVVFFLLTFVPLAALRGIIPYTHDLLFGYGFEVTVQNHASTGVLVLDVLRAMGIGVAYEMALFLALTLPFVSLSRAYGQVPGHAAALRLMLYRAWLLPLAMEGAVLYFAFWASPEGAADAVLLAVRAIEVGGLVVLIIAMRTVARVAHGTGPFASLLVVAVPLALLVLTYQMLPELLAPVLPEPPPEAAEVSGSR